MAEEGVVEATWTEAKAHPYIIGGAVVVLVALLWYLGKPAPAATPPHFSFSYGPSDAQVLAGTQLAIAQQADTTALTKANISAGVDNNYFNYLTQASSNALSLGTSQINVAGTVAENTAAFANNTQVLDNANNNATAIALQRLISTGQG